MFKKKHILLILFTTWNIYAKTEHMKADYKFHIHNETSKPILVSFFIATHEFAPKASNAKQETKAKKIGLFDNLISAHTNQKIKLGEFGWFSPKGMGYGKNKEVEVLEHGFADTMHIFAPGDPKTSLIRRINLQQKKASFYITEDDSGTISINTYKPQMPLATDAQKKSSIISLKQQNASQRK